MDEIKKCCMKQWREENSRINHLCQLDPLHTESHECSCGQTLELEE